MEVTAGMTRPDPSVRGGNGADTPDAARNVAANGGHIELATRAPSAMLSAPPIAGYIVPISPGIRGYPYIPPAYSSGPPRAAQPAADEPSEILKPATSTHTPSSEGRRARASSADSTHGSKQAEEDKPVQAEPPSRCPLPFCMLALCGAIVVAGIVAGVLVSLSSPLTVVVQSSNAKQRWLTDAIALFNQKAFHTSEGRRIEVTASFGGSIFDASLMPHIFSPATMQSVDQQNLLAPVISNPATACKSSVGVPVGFAMWRSMAVALGWPNATIQFKTLAALAQSPVGWASLGAQYDQWGKFHMGHGFPFHSTSGRLAVTGMVHTITNTTAGEQLTEAAITSPATRSGLHEIAKAVSHMGPLDTSLLEKMRERGPSYLHTVATSESNVFRWNYEHGPSGTNTLEEPLVFVAPQEGTFWAEHPMCPLDQVEWTSPRLLEASQVFVEFMQTVEAQTLGFKHGTRPYLTMQGLLPADAEVFSVANGLLPDLSPEVSPVLPLPSNDIVNVLLRTWKAEKKPARVVCVFDTSGSMAGRPMAAAKDALVSFLDTMADHDFIRILTFASTTKALAPQGTLVEVRPALQAAVRAIQPIGSTRLFGSISQALDDISDLRAVDEGSGESFSYIVVVMTDGQDNIGGEAEMWSRIPDGSATDQLHIFTVAFGQNTGSSATILRRIAEQTNGKHFTASESDIGDIYEQISMEF